MNMRSLRQRTVVQAVDVLEQYKTEISIVLLDIVMPEMDGFGVLTVMNQRQWINDIPVIMISSEGRESHLEHAYELGITDFISRPFDVRDCPLQGGQHHPSVCQAEKIGKPCG